jgi:hypothetical protein
MMDSILEAIDKTTDLSIASKLLRNVRIPPPVTPERKSLCASTTYPSLLTRVFHAYENIPFLLYHAGCPTLGSTKSLINRVMIDDFI